MSKRFYRKIIDDVSTSLHITESERAGLLTIFEYSIGSMGATLASEAHFDLADFYSAQQNNLTGFTLLLKRQDDADDLWHGVFKHKEKPHKELKVLGHLEF